MYIVELIVILLAKIVEVSLTTLRLVFINKGNKLLVTIIGFIEVTIWLKVASVVLVGINEHPAKMIVYAVGFALGNYIGLLIEDKLGLGYSQIQIITSLENCENLANFIRGKGKAVTVVNAEGKDSNKVILFTYVKRKDKDKLVNQINDLNISCVITISETQKIYGGFGVK